MHLNPICRTAGALLAIVVATACASASTSDYTAELDGFADYLEATQSASEAALSPIAEYELDTIAGYEIGIRRSYLQGVKDRIAAAQNQAYEVHVSIAPAMERYLRAEKEATRDLATSGRELEALALTRSGQHELSDSLMRSESDNDVLLRSVTYHCDRRTRDLRDVGARNEALLERLTVVHKRIGEMLAEITAWEKTQGTAK
jgi:hypothetical protein